MEEKDQDAGPANFMQLTPTGKQLEEEEILISGTDNDEGDLVMM